MNNSRTDSFSCDPCNKIKKYLHYLIENLSTEGFMYILFQLISFAVMVICLSVDEWLSGSYGNQGLWGYCINNEDVKCCAHIYDVIERQHFINAINAFLIIECLLFGPAIILSFLEQVEKKTYTVFSALFWIGIAFCSFFSMVIYGAKYKDVSKDQSLSACYILCVLNFFGQIGIVAYGLMIS